MKSVKLLLALSILSKTNLHVHIYKTTFLQTKIKVGISCYLFNSSLDLVQGIKQSSRNVFQYILKKCENQHHNIFQ